MSLQVNTRNNSTGMGSIRKTRKHIWKKYAGKMAKLLGSHTVVYKEPQLRNAGGGGQVLQGFSKQRSKKCGFLIVVCVLGVETCS